ncbi:MAG: hypothetical protein CMM05_06465 [Rhodopirellula sp.]|nr:hypothetical protein [Rhodopirellula sp.]
MQTHCIYRLLTQRASAVNEKRLQRPWKREHVQVPRKQQRWRLDYNHHRLHSSLAYQTPAAYAADCIPQS